MVRYIEMVITKMVNINDVMILYLSCLNNLIPCDVMAKIVNVNIDAMAMIIYSFMVLFVLRFVLS